MSHAATAYLGHIQGHKYIYEAIQDPLVRPIVEAALQESCLGLSRKHGLDKIALDAFSADLIRRYQNKALADQVARVGADPKRKLGPEDRLIAPARMCVQQGVKPIALVQVIIAALDFEEPNDPAAVEMQMLLRLKGVDGVLDTICQLGPNEPLRELIEDVVAPT
jgi:mannitol-1-phosphate 5-dehydrogenase